MGRWLHIFVRLFGNHSLRFHQHDGLITIVILTCERWSILQDFPIAFSFDTCTDQGWMGVLHRSLPIISTARCWRAHFRHFSRELIHILNYKLWVDCSQAERVSRETPPQWKVPVDVHDTSLFIFTFMGIQMAPLDYMCTWSCSHRNDSFSSHYSAASYEASWVNWSFLGSLSAFNSLSCNFVNIRLMLRYPS